MKARHALPKLAVVTWFYDEQPGFLDFRYRVAALHPHYDVTLVLRHDRFRGEFDLPGLRTLVLQEDSSGTRSLLHYVWRVAHRLRAERPDAVLLLGAQLAPVVFFLPGMPVGLYWNEHPTHTFHGGRWGMASTLLSGLLVRLSFAAARRATLVMPIGEAHRDDLAEHGVSPDRTSMVYMGVAERFAHLTSAKVERSAEEPLSLIYTGTVERERGRDVMLEGLALARAQGAACTLTLVGASDTQRDYCLRRGAELGISDVLTVVGRVAGHEIPAYLLRADAGICIWEDRVWWRFNPPTKLFEYLAAGLPILASRIGTHTRYVHDGENGLVFDYDAASFSQAVQRLCALRARLPAMARAAAQSGEPFMWPRIEPQLLKLIGQLIGPHPSDTGSARTRANS